MVRGGEEGEGKFELGGDGEMGMAGWESVREGWQRGSGGGGNR